MLPSNANLDDSQRVSILTATVSSAEKKEDGSHPSNSELLEEVKNDLVPALLRQFGKPEPTEVNEIGIHAMNASRAGISLKNVSNSQRGGGASSTGSRPRRSAAEMAELRTKFSCHECHQYGHWSYDHNLNRTLRKKKMLC